MSTHDALVDHCLELLSPLGLPRARRMFGGHGLTIDGVFMALIAFDRLYLKVDGLTQPRFAQAGCEPFVYDGKGKRVTMSYWTAPPQAMDSPALMQPWARLALDAALRARASKDSTRQRRIAATAGKLAPGKPTSRARKAHRDRE